MTEYSYDITTTIGEGFGTVSASDEDSARELLTQQYSGVSTDSDGKEFNIEVVSLALTAKG